MEIIVFTTTMLDLVGKKVVNLKVKATGTTI